MSWRVRKGRWSLLPVVLLVLLVALGSSPWTPVGAQTSKPGTPGAVGGVTRLILATAATPTQSAGQGMQKFAELVKQKSGGKLVIDPHLSSSLYSEIPSIQAVLNGSLDIGSASNSNMGSFTDAFFFMDLPLLVQSKQGLRKLLSTQVGEDVRRSLEEKNGLKVLMLLDNGGFRQVLTTRRAVKVPGDLKGLKIRTPGTPVELAIWRAWGAIPTPIDWSEVYLALSQGAIDGEGLQFTWAEAGRHLEVLKHAAEVNYALAVMVVVMRLDRFTALPVDVQRTLTEAGAETEKWEAAVDDRAVSQARDKAMKQGMQIYLPSPDEAKIWREMSVSVWQQFKSKVGPEFIERIREAQK